MGVYCADPKTHCVCAGVSRVCTAPDVLTVAILLISIQVLYAIRFEGPSRRSLFRHACTRPPQSRAFTHEIPDVENRSTAAHPLKDARARNWSKLKIEASCCAIVAALHDWDPAGMLLAGQYEPYETNITHKLDWPGVR
jgi:hypothetical protein